MRENKGRIIKFRAWDHLQGGMINPDNLYANSEKLSTFFTNRARFVFMQFTNHKDNKGVEIYEDDIIRNIHREDWLGVVVYDIRWGGYAYKRVHRAYNRPEPFLKAKSWTVIGNIHDNPELLEG